MVELEGTTVTWTQYGKPAQDELRRVVAKAEQSDLLAPVTLIVPNNLAGVAARRSLAQGLKQGGPAGVAALTVLTLDRLAELVAAPSLTAAGRRPLTSTVLAAAWRAELTADPGIFVEVAQHPATVTALVRAHRQLRELTGDAIEAVAATGTLPAALIALHRRVVDRTNDRWYDVVDLRATATGALQAEQLTELGAIVVHLPQELERSQIGLLQKLATATLVRVVSGQTGNNHADAGVLATAQAWGLALPESKPRLPVAKEIHHASDSDDEVRGVVRQLVTSLKEKPGHRIAVLYGNRVPYARLLHEHPSRAGIAFNGPGVRPTAERQVPRALLQLLALAEDDVDRAGLLALLAGAKVLDAQGKPVPSSRWERMARYSATERAKADAEDPSRPGIIDRRRRDADAADALRLFVEELRTVLAQGRTTSTWTGLSTWSLSVLHRYLGDEDDSRSRPEDQRAAAKVVSVLSSLTALNEVSDVADLETLRYVVELQLEEDLPRTGTFGTGVFVGPMSSAVGLELDEVYLVGLAEGITPGRLREDALLPEAARVAADGQLPALRARLDREHRHLMAALACAPTVTASFPRGDLRRGGERLPSR